MHLPYRSFECTPQFYTMPRIGHKPWTLLREGNHTQSVTSRLVSTAQGSSHQQQEHHRQVALTTSNLSINLHTHTPW